MKEGDQSIVRDLLLNRLAEALRAVPYLVAAYAHGSIVTTRFRADSDVDCALLFPPGHSFNAPLRRQLEADLAVAVGRTVDVGILSSDNLVYFAETIRHGRRIFCADETLADELVGRALSLYARLKEDRRAVEAAYHAA